MAILSMHLLVGEHVFPQIRELGRHPSLYGTFLPGCGSDALWIWDVG
jgi:hypothetical protein